MKVEPITPVDQTNFPCATCGKKIKPKGCTLCNGRKAIYGKSPKVSDESQHFDFWV